MRKTAFRAAEGEPESKKWQATKFCSTQNKKEVTAVKIDDVFERKVIEKFDIRPEIKKLPKKELLQLLNQLFKDEYQGKTVNYALLERELFVKTTARTRMHFGVKNKKASFKGHKTKLYLSASGNYLSLIENCEYSHSEIDKKPDQNALHQNTEAWHYFTKMILCENTYYQVMVDVNESKNGGLFVYNVSLAPCRGDMFLEKASEDENKKEGSMHSAPKLTDLRDGTSCDDIISKEKNYVNTFLENNSKNFEKCSKKASLDSQVQRAENKRCDHAPMDTARNEKKDRE